MHELVVAEDLFIFYCWPDTSIVFGTYQNCVVCREVQFNRCDVVYVSVCRVAEWHRGIGCLFASILFKFKTAGHLFVLARRRCNGLLCGV